MDHHSVKMVYDYTANMMEALNISKYLNNRQKLMSEVRSLLFSMNQFMTAFQFALEMVYHSNFQLLWLQHELDMYPENVMERKDGALIVSSFVTSPAGAYQPVDAESLSGI